MAMLIVGILYSRYYKDFAEYNGERNWPWLRIKIRSVVKLIEKYLWSHRVEYHQGVKAFVRTNLENGLASRQIALIGERHPIFSIGLYIHLYGSKSLSTLLVRHEWPLFYLFRIPFLRDVLLWLGMICGDALDGGRSFCGTGDPTLLKNLWEKKVPIIPILQRGEEGVWRVWKNDWMEKNIWPTTRRLFTIPFPYFFYLLPGQITTHYFPPIEPTDFHTHQEFIEYYNTIIEKIEKKIVKVFSRER